METTLLLSIFHVFTSFPLISCKIFPNGPILGWKVEPGVAHPWKCQAEGEQITFLSLPPYSLFLLEKSAIVNSTSASHLWACQSFTKISQYIIVCASSISAMSLSRKLRWFDVICFGPNHAGCYFSPCSPVDTYRQILLTHSVSFQESNLVEYVIPCILLSPILKIFFTFALFLFGHFACSLWVPKAPHLQLQDCFTNLPTYIGVN